MPKVFKCAQQTCLIPGTTSIFTSYLSLSKQIWIKYCLQIPKRFQRYLYSYFSIVYQNCIVNLGRPFNGVKLFQYTINNLYSNSRIGHYSQKLLRSTLKAQKRDLFLQKSSQKLVKALKKYFFLLLLQLKSVNNNSFFNLI